MLLMRVYSIQFLLLLSDSFSFVFFFLPFQRLLCWYIRVYMSVYLYLYIFTLKVRLVWFVRVVVVFAVTLENCI